MIESNQSLITIWLLYADRVDSVPGIPHAAAPPVGFKTTIMERLFPAAHPRSSSSPSSASQPQFDYIRMSDNVIYIDPMSWNF